MRTFYTNLPCFPGFYGTQLSPDGECGIDELVEYMDHYTTLPPKLIARYFELADNDRLMSFDHEEYKKNIARKFCAAVEDCLSEILREKVKVEFKEIQSPRFYNFENDRVTCNITFDPGAVVSYARKHYAAFSRYIREEFTTRSGFISFMSNNPADWLDPSEWDDRHPGVILDFILKNEIPDAEITLSERVLENTYLMDFVSIPPAIEQYLESPDAAKIGREYIRLMDQGDEYLRLMGEKYRDEVQRQKERVTNELAGEMLEAASRLGEEMEKAKAV